MGWFDEQIRQRIAHDEECFADAFTAMAGAVMGNKVMRTLADERIQVRNAMEAILKYYHIKPVEIPESIRDRDEQLEYLMRPAGIMRRTVHLEGAWYKDAYGAMLGSRKEDGTPVALLPYGLNGYRFFDSETGSWVKLNKRTASLIDREAVCFYKPLPLKALGIRELFLYIVQCMNPVDFLLVGASAAAVSLLGMLIPVIQKLIYGSVIQSTSLQLLFAVFSFLICVQLSQLLVGTVKQLLLNRLERKMSVSLQAATMMRVLSLPAKFFMKYASGDLFSRMEYVSVLCTILTETVLTTGLTGIFSLVYIAQMTAYGPGLAVPGLIVIGGTVLLSLASTFVQFAISRKRMELMAKEAGLEYGLITGIQKIRLSGAEKRAFAKWAQLYTKSARLQYDIPAFLKIAEVVSGALSFIGTIVIYYYTIRTQVSLADYYAFNSAYGMVTGAFASLTGMAGTFAQVKPMLEMVRPILETVPEVAENKRVITRLAGGIEINNVSFRYTENGPLILDDISLKIRPGQYVAIVGATGCGKSTLMRLLLGFETPQKGAIYYDGHDLASLDLKSLRQNIGTVMQNGKLFQGDLYSNIVVSAPQLTMDDAWEAAEMAGVAEDIRAMPMGMHTMISEGSGGISGGQRQRLMIARAIAPKPKILMFDEATSALDNVTQKIVSESLDSLKCTRIVIAHRLSTIRQCDRILVLDKGKIIEDGSYEELLARNGYFAGLVARQRLDQQPAE